MPKQHRRPRPLARLISTNLRRLSKPSPMSRHLRPPRSPCRHRRSKPPSRHRLHAGGRGIDDGGGSLAGCRGFGVCRDLDGLARLSALRRYELFSDPPTPASPSAGTVQADPEKGPPAADEPAEPPVALPSAPELSASISSETSQPTDLETSVDTPQNVVPFRPIGDQKSPVLTPVENSAFNELARQLAERLESESREADAKPATPDAPETTLDHPPPPPMPQAPPTPEPSEQPGWLAHPEPPARGGARRHKMLLDLLPLAVLIYPLS